MRQRKGNLSEKEHESMDDFLARVLDAYKDGNISRNEAVAGLAHVMAALDIGNPIEAISWFNQDGVSFFKK